MAVTEVGMDTEVSEVQEPKALKSMAVTEVGIKTEVMVEHPLKALSGI